MAKLDDPAIVDELCNRLAEGMALCEACATDDMPNESTVYRRMASDEEFASRIARAREAQQDAEADKIIKLADEANAENWQVKKLQIWARQWRMSKLAAKKYGDKQTVEHAGTIKHETDDAAEARAEIARFLEGERQREASGITKH